VVTHLVEVPREPGGPAARSDAELVLDLVVGIVGATVGAGVALARVASELPVVRSRGGWHAPLVPARWQPAAVLTDVAQRGARHRTWAAQGVERLLDQWTPVIVERMVSRLDLTSIVTRHVDIDEVVKAVDLDAAVADVDLDAVVQRIDLDAVVRRIDLDAAVRRVDLDAAVAGVDIDAIAGRLDIDAVIDRVDLVTMVEEVIAAIDLPAIIRDSSGSMASETLRSARMAGISSDDAVGRTLERHLFRRRRPTRPDGPDG
jgi:hypothetical protein